MTTKETDSLIFNSLVEHYLANKVENLPLLKKFAIEQDVSFAYEWFIHKHMRMETQESFNFSTYTCLIQAEPEYYGNYIEVMLDKINIPEEIIEQCLQYIRTGEIPYQLWINKLIADLRGSDYYSKHSIPGMLLVYLCKTMRVSLVGYMKLYKALSEADLDEELQNVISVAHAMYMDLPKDWKEAYMRLFSAEDEELRRKFADNELTLFTETLIDMTQYPLNLQMLEDIEKGKLPAGSIFWSEPPYKPEPLINRSRIPLGVKVPTEAQGTGMTDFRNLFDDNKSVSLIADLVQDEVTEEPKVTEYIVEKVALRGSKRAMSRNKFNTEEEAERFIEDVVNAVPDIIKSFQFTINGNPYILKRDR